MSTPSINTGVVMKTQDAIEHFGGIKQLAEALSIWPHNISRWGDTVPLARQYELEVKSGGRLKANDDNQPK
jgi:hypothetical protein